MKIWLQFTCAFSVFLTCASSATAITITANNAQAVVPGGLLRRFSGTSIPANHLLRSEIGANYSENQIDYFGSGSQVTLSNKISQKRSGRWSFAWTENSLSFTATADTTYDLSGEYHNLDGSAANVSRVHFHVYLFDITGGGYLFRNYQQSEATHDQSFVLGNTDADARNLLVGSRLGSLTSGRQYRLYFEAFTQSKDEIDSGAAASGHVTLKIGGGASTPDSGATLLLVILAFVSLGAMRARLS